MNSPGTDAPLELHDVVQRMLLPMEGRTAVVIGGASGIGRTTATLLAAYGARVALWDVAAKTDEVASAVQTEADALRGRTATFGPVTQAAAAARGPHRSPESSDVPSAGAEDCRVIGFRTDVADEASVREAVQNTEARLGAIDVCVHAAAVASGHYGFPFWNVPSSAWKRVVDVELMGTVHVATAVGPRMAERRRGVFVLVGSVAGLIGSQTDPPYSAAKAATRNFAHCMAKDLAPLGVRVNVVCPGMVKTPLNRAVWEAWARRQPSGAAVDYETWAAEKISRLVPTGRWQSAAEVAAAIAFLCSDVAPSITGQTLNVDGGYVMT